MQTLVLENNTVHHNSSGKTTEEYRLGHAPLDFYRKILMDRQTKADVKRMRVILLLVDRDAQSKRKARFHCQRFNFLRMRFAIIQLSQLGCK
jgi:hypothetical protein